MLLGVGVCRTEVGGRQGHRFGDGAGNRSRGHRRGPASSSQGFSHRDNTGLGPWHLHMPDPVSGVWTEVARKRRKTIISF